MYDMRFLWILVVSSLAGGQVHEQPPFFPSDFQVDVVVNAWNQKDLKSFTIAFTAKGNGRGNLLYVKETVDSVDYFKVLDFDKDIIILANSKDESCKHGKGIPDDEKTSPFFPVTFERTGSKVKFPQPDTLFRFDGKKTYKENTDGGISRWTSAAVVHDSAAKKDLNCTVEFAWTTNGTKTPRCDRNVENFNACPPVPVLSEVNCGGKLITYLFSGYTEELDYSIFQEPLGFYCDGKDTVSLPKLPDVFSLRAENILPGSENKVWYSYLWVDLENNAVATRDRVEDRDVIIVTDYRSGFQYEIGVVTETCIPKANAVKAFDPDSKNKLAWGEEILGDAQFSGDHKCRLSQCRVYATISGDKVQNLYYAYDDRLDFGLGDPRRPTYMQTRNRGILQSERHIVAYDENVRYWDVFNLYRCFHQEDIRMLSVALEGNTDFDKDIVSLDVLRDAYRVAVVKALGISQTLRFTRFWIVPNKTRTGMTVTGFVYPARNENGFEDVDTDKAINTLKAVVDGGKFSFQLNSTFEDGLLTYKGVSVSGGYRRPGGSAAGKAEAHAGGEQKGAAGYTSGNMAGLGFGMLFLGIALTAAAIYVASRYYPRSQVSMILLQNQG